MCESRQEFLRVVQQNRRRLRRQVAALATTADLDGLRRRASPRTPEQPPATQGTEASNSDGGRQFLQVASLLAQHAESRGDDYRVLGAQLRPDSKSGGTPHAEWWNRYREWRKRERRHQVWQERQYLLRRALSVSRGLKGGRDGAQSQVDSAPQNESPGGQRSDATVWRPPSPPILETRAGSGSSDLEEQRHQHDEQSVEAPRRPFSNNRSPRRPTVPRLLLTAAASTLSQHAEARKQSLAGLGAQWRLVLTPFDYLAGGDQRTERNAEWWQQYQSWGDVLHQEQVWIQRHALLSHLWVLSRPFQARAGTRPTGPRGGDLASQAFEIVG